LNVKDAENGLLFVLFYLVQYLPIKTVKNVQ